MEKLKAYREEIDAIDAQLIQLFEARMDVVLQVAKYKKENHIEVLHQGREQEVLERAQQQLQNKTYAPALTAFLQSTMDISKDLQRTLIDNEN